MAASPRARLLELFKDWTVIGDRRAGTRERLAPHYPFFPIFTIRDSGIEPLG
jgi:hypothetical protein